MHTRLIPSSREALPVVGLGTYRGFDVAPASDDYRALGGVLDALFAAGGSVIDSSPMYGRAERTTGELLAARTPRPHPFLATKVWTSGREAGVAQVAQSFRLLQTATIDLLQINYALDDRAAEARLLPLARDRGVAVLVNMPFGGGGLLGRLRDRPRPAWAGDASWAQLALRFVLGHPAVTCVIPGTGSPRNMADNAAAGAAPPLDEAQRRELVALAG